MSSYLNGITTSLRSPDMVRLLHLIPQPKNIEFSSGQLSLGRLALNLGSGVTAHLATARLAKHWPQSGSDLTVTLTLNSDLAHEAYTLEITSIAVFISASGDVGFFYAVLTLLQIVRQSGSTLPCLKIIDQPDFSVRGFYHDISRGKVPKLSTILALIEKLAAYKINHFQLYVEHSYTFESHPEIWAGSDALSVDDLQMIDQHCQKHFIDFVPSLSTFGHAYFAIRNRRNQSLNEFDLDATAVPFSMKDSMGHYTLDCSNPASLELIDDLIGDFSPNFTSKLFNICCDETFDLGKGRNADKAADVGVGRLYIDFLKQVCHLVRSRGFRPMFWGDVILKHPELVAELPEDAIVLNWCYDPAVREESSKLFAEVGLPFYVCSGVWGWRRWLHDIDRGTTNIRRFAEQGLKQGAVGLLNTDWGDHGHLNFLSGSYHGLAYGAAAGWNVSAAADEQSFDRAFSCIELGLHDDALIALLRKMGSTQVVIWGDISNWLTDPACVDENWFHENGLTHYINDLDAQDIIYARKALSRYAVLVNALLEDSNPEDQLFVDELQLGVQGCLLMHDLALCLKGAGCERPAAAVADELRWLERKLSHLWHLRNRPSDYYRAKLLLLEAAERLDAL